MTNRSDNQSMNEGKDYQDNFNLISEYKPAGDQGSAITSLITGLHDGLSKPPFVGVTGSGKTFTMAHVIAKLGRPTLVLAPNKTLAAG